MPVGRSYVKVFFSFPPLRSSRGREQTKLGTKWSGEG